MKSGGTPIPPSLDLLLLADWMEINATIAPDGDFSAEALKGDIRRGDLGHVAVEKYFGQASSPLGDLINEISRGSLLAGTPPLLRDLSETELDPESQEQPQPRAMEEDNAIETCSDEVLAELGRRQRIADHAYPFELTAGALAMRTPQAWRDFIPYIFCLLLSYSGIHLRATIPNSVRSLFEVLAREAARNYLGGIGERGEAIRFGFPRDGAEVPRGFEEAVDHVAAAVAEGRGARSTSEMTPLDGGVDVIAWKPFPDQQVGKLVIAGNCATGRNIDALRREKARELNPDELRGIIEEWFLDCPASPWLPAFFVPHQLDLENDRWISRVRRSKLLVFDRFRVAYWAQFEWQGLHEHEQWIETTLGTIGEQL